jgi:hypothetical protein
MGKGIDREEPPVLETNPPEKVLEKRAFLTMRIMLSSRELSCCPVRTALR